MEKASEWKKIERDGETEICGEPIEINMYVKILVRTNDWARYAFDAFMRKNINCVRVPFINDKVCQLTDSIPLIQWVWSDKEIILLQKLFTPFGYIWKLWWRQIDLSVVIPQKQQQQPKIMYKNLNVQKKYHRMMFIRQVCILLNEPLFQDAFLYHRFSTKTTTITTAIANRIYILQRTISKQDSVLIQFSQSILSADI